ncbi:TetR/AcrR family transcriptional regulator [Nocardioides yefusunii]|uniref:TetR/AcrR family transcriptional regulator n=1 Tax=Nocardioides yefusunii TaxID=2500546 RepID=A0ABW1R229_9ACTN|nr:TetR/AcrR family transcriptional regulator [Nocardioides yefusunii]
MSSTEPSAGAGPRSRDAARTRAAVLDAAERLMNQQGTRVSLALVAREAGVTKSGLLHHFGSREELLVGVARHVLARTWAEVAACADSDDTAPGAFTRAYVRAFTGDSAYLEDLMSATGLLARFGTEQGMEHVFGLDPEDPARWNAAFAADGLPLARVWAVRYAVEGLSVSRGTPYLTDEQLEATRAELIALTY